MHTLYVHLLLQANVAIVSIWILSLFFAACPLIGWNKYVSEVGQMHQMNENSSPSVYLQSHMVGCVFDGFSRDLNSSSYVLTLLLVAWTVPMVLIVVCYVGILATVKRSFIEFSNEGPNRRKVRIVHQVEGSGSQFLSVCLSCLCCAKCFLFHSNRFVLYYTTTIVWQ